MAEDDVGICAHGDVADLRGVAPGDGLGVGEVTEHAVADVDGVRLVAEEEQVFPLRPAAARTFPSEEAGEGLAQADGKADEADGEAAGVGVMLAVEDEHGAVEGV